MPDFPALLCRVALRLAAETGKFNEPPPSGILRLIVRIFAEKFAGFRLPFTPKTPFAHNRRRLKMNTLTVALLAAVVIAALSGCANENPDLVNPPPGLDSIYVRFVNFASDGAPRSLSLESSASTSTVGFGQTSAVIQSPADSARLVVMNGQTAELTTPTRFRFTRSSFLTVIAVPSGGSVPRPFDTIIALNTLAASSVATTEASVRICNVSPDSNVTYSIKLGCQNGTEIARDAGFRSASGYREIPSGQTGITLLRNPAAATEPEVVGLFSMNFAARKSYTFFVFANSSGSPGLLALDDRSGGADALQPLLPVAERTAEMQAYNFSRRELTALKISGGAGETIAAGLAPLGVGEVRLVSACGSLTTDRTVALTAAGDTAGTGFFTLEVLRKYAVFWFDVPASVNFAPVIVRKTAVSKPDSAVITVVNGAFSQGAATVSLGARTNAEQPLGYSSGEILCSRLPSGGYAAPVAIPAGELPVTAFSTSLPARLLLAAPATVLPGKQYYLVLRDNAAAIGGIEAALIEETEANTQAGILAPGGFVQIVNAAAGDNLTVGFDRILANARVPYTGAVATILPVGQRSVAAGGTNATVQAAGDSSMMIIAAGQAANLDVFQINTPAGASRPGQLRRRYINAAGDVAGMSVAFNSATDTNYIAQNIAYRASFDEPPLNYERKISVYFLESATKRPLDSMQNVLLPSGKNYSLILTGSAGKYRIVTQQEF